MSSPGNPHEQKRRIGFIGQPSEIHPLYMELFKKRGIELVDLSAQFQEVKQEKDTLEALLKRENISNLLLGGDSHDIKKVKHKLEEIHAQLKIFILVAHHELDSLSRLFEFVNKDPEKPQRQVKESHPRLEEIVRIFVEVPGERIKITGPMMYKNDEPVNYKEGLPDRGHTVNVGDVVSLASSSAGKSPLRFELLEFRMSNHNKHSYSKENGAMDEYRWVFTAKMISPNERQSSNNQLTRISEKDAQNRVLLHIVLNLTGNPYFMVIPWSERPVKK
jgi:hypothetical protein